MRDAFYEYHPAVNFIYFAAVIICGMLFMHPLALILGLVCSLGYYAYLRQGKIWRFAFGLLLPILLFTAIFNPLFNHQGATIITYFPNGNPLTAESIFYGLAAAALLGTLLCWFFCLNMVLNSEKIIYLFGCICPTLALWLTMTLRFVPRLVTQFRESAAGRKALGGDITKGTLRMRLRNMSAVLTAVLNKSLEDAVDTADSMKSRGYGLPGRTAYSRYYWTRRDSVFLAFCLVLLIYVAIGAVYGCFNYNYFPMLANFAHSAYQLSVLAAYGLLLLMPIAADIFEEIVWRRSA